MTTSSKVAGALYTLERVELPAVDAIVTACCASTGERIGTLELQREHINRRPCWRIAFVSVKSYRRREGVARAMLACAREQLGHVEHGACITEAGWAWAAAVG